MTVQLLLEEVIATRVKSLYFESVRHDQAFHAAPYFRLELFKQHFATAAHERQIFHRDNAARYNHYFKLVKAELEAAICRLAENEQAIHPRLPPSGQQATPCDKAVAIQRLMALRDEIAARPQKYY